PADHAAGQLSGLCDIQQIQRLRLGRRGLHPDRSLDPGCGEMRRQVRQPEIAIDWCQLRRQPAIVAPREAPQMMMRIDTHPAATAGTGASGSRRRSAFKSLQSAAGTTEDNPATLRSTSCGVSAPSTTLATAGWPKAKCSAAMGNATPWAVQTRSIRATLARISGGAS